MKGMSMNSFENFVMQTPPPNPLEHLPNKIGHQQWAAGIADMEESWKPFIKEDSFIPEANDLYKNLVAMHDQLMSLPPEQLTNERIMEGEALRQRIDDLVEDYLYSKRYAA